MGDGRQGTALQPTRPSQPRSFKHTHGWTHVITRTLAPTNTHKVKAEQTIGKEPKQTEKVLVFSPRYYLLLSLFSLCFYVMSPCKKSFMVFPGLMAVSAVKSIVGALKPLQDQHLVRVTREHQQRTSPCKLGNSLI